MFEQLCQHTIIQLTIAHLLTHQLHNRSHTFVTRDSAGITWHTRNCKIRNKTSIYSASHQCAFTIYHETTLYYYYLKSIGVGWVGWKSKKVSRYFCTAPPRPRAGTWVCRAPDPLRRAAARQAPDPGPGFPARDIYWNGCGVIKQQSGGF